MPLSGIHIETILIKTVEQIGDNHHSGSSAQAALLQDLPGMKLCLKAGTWGAFGAMLGVGKTIVEWPFRPSADTTGP